MNTSQSYLMEGMKHPHPLGFLHRFFEDRTISSARDLALEFEGNSMSYAQLNAMANRTARILIRNARTLNAQPNPDGDFLVAVQMPPSDHLVALLLGIIKAGAAYVPLDMAFPQGRIEHILRDSAPFCMIRSGGTNENSDVPLISWEELTDDHEVPDTNLPPEETLTGKEDTSEKVAMVLYTSGSTGTPKGVRLSHRAVLNRLGWQFRQFPFEPTEVVCFKTALTFVDSVSEIFAPLIKGFPIVVVPKKDTQNPETFLNMLETKRVSRLVLVPSLLRSLLWARSIGKKGQQVGDPLPNLKLWICSGETLPADLLREFFRCFPTGHTVANFYGSTEVMGDVTFQTFQSGQEAEDSLVDGKVPIGRSVDNSSIYILDGETLSSAAEGKVGEIFVGGSNLCTGYVNSKTSDKFIKNPFGDNLLYKTGDFGRLVGGTLIYEGRADSQLKVRGHRVDLSEIQAGLQNIPDVDKAVVLANEPGLPGQNILAFFTSASLTSEAVTLMMKTGTLAPYMMPDYVEKLDSIPLLHNGKIDRQGLLKHYHAVLQKQAVAPINLDLSGVPAEKLSAATVLLETVCKVLMGNKSTVSLKSNFFHAGGNSLNAVFTVTRLNDQGFSIGIAEFLEAATLEDVLNRMRPVAKAEDSPTCFEELSTYRAEPLGPEHRSDIMHIIASSFSEKGDLEKWTRGSYEEFVDLINQAWEPLVGKGFSFAVRDASNKIVAVAFNFDVYDEPEIHPAKAIEYVFDLLEFVEAPSREKIPKGKGKLLHSFMMGTAPELTPAQNVDVIHFMELENMRVAKKKNMTGLMTTNTSALTQQICEDVLGYEPISCCQVNQYVAPDGTKPFGAAPDDQTAICSWKNITNCAGDA